jgi:hypothetical protein
MGLTPVVEGHVVFHILQYQPFNVGVSTVAQHQYGNGLSADRSAKMVNHENRSTSNACRMA